MDPVRLHPIGKESSNSQQATNLDSFINTLFIVLEIRTLHDSIRLPLTAYQSFSFYHLDGIQTMVLNIYLSSIHPFIHQSNTICFPNLMIKFVSLISINYLPCH